MYSGPDLLAEGFPHSDIRGSTIARISPRLIAACHVLHRLLAPRHPPNALLILIIHHRPRAGPNRPRGHPPERPDRHASNRTTAQHRDTQLLTGSQPARHSTHQFRFTCQTTQVVPQVDSGMTQSSESGRRYHTYSLSRADYTTASHREWRTEPAIRQNIAGSTATRMHPHSASRSYP